MICSPNLELEKQSHVENEDIVVSNVVVEPYSQVFFCKCAILVINFHRCQRGQFFENSVIAATGLSAARIFVEYKRHSPSPLKMAGASLLLSG